MIRVDWEWVWLFAVWVVLVLLARLPAEVVTGKAPGQTACSTDVARAAKDQTRMEMTHD